MEKKQVQIEAVSMPNKGVSFDKGWHTVVGKAADYMESVQKGLADITLNEQGQVTFVKMVNAAEGNKAPQQQTNYSKGTSQDSNKMASVCVSYAKDVWCAGKIEEKDIAKTAKNFQDAINLLANGTVDTTEEYPEY